MATPYTTVLADLLRRQEQLGSLIEALKVWAPGEDSPRPSPDPGPENTIPAESKEVAGQKDFSGLPMWKAAELIMRQSGREMNLADLARSIGEAGLYIDPSRYHSLLTSALNRKPDLFEKTGKATWKVLNGR